MSWQTEWLAIDQTIVEFSAICNELVSALTANSSDNLSAIKKVVLPMSRDIARRLTLFSERYESQLPADLIQQVKAFCEDIQLESGNLTSTTGKSPTAVAYFSTQFQRIRSDFNYATSELEGAVLRITERAFLHLQKSIVADPDIREKWIKAYEKGEPTCEKLGAVHLLLHGIWSFKANSEGERTDLVLGEPIKGDDLNQVYLTAEGLVLTEWKVTDGSDRQKKYSQALEQAELYAKGSLASIELQGYRYLVIVSKDLLTDLPDDAVIESVTYRYINIAVDPSTPSKVVS